MQPEEAVQRQRALGAAVLSAGSGRSLAGGVRARSEQSAEIQPVRHRQILVHHHARSAGQQHRAGRRLWQLERIGQPVTSNDGRFIVAPVTSFDVKADKGHTRLWLFSADGKRVATPIYDGTPLGAGAKIKGPAVIEEVTTTIVIEPGWTAVLDASGSYLITRDKKKAAH